jgi:hypothetical protein
MTTNFSVINQVPYLRTTREFPAELKQLSIEANKAYLDTANVVNNRTIGLYPTTRPAITGNRYYLSANKSQQTFRQVYTFTSAGSIAHGITIANIAGFVFISGSFTDGTVFYPLPYIDVVAANNQINVTITATDIVITAGAGAPPNIVSGVIVIEWLSQP